jgi:hypothetical protein
VSQSIFWLASYTILLSLSICTKLTIKSYEPGPSSLHASCERCKAAWSRAMSINPENNPDRRTQLGDVEQIRRGAKSGCHLCALVESCLVSSMNRQGDTMVTLRWVEYSREHGMADLYFGKVSPGLRQNPLFWTKSIPPSPLLPYDSYYQTSDVGFRFWVIENIRRWLDACTSTHSSKCNRHTTQPNQCLPTRLIHIQGPDQIKLVVHDENWPDFTAQSTCYATVSHCWGKGDFLKLQGSNIVSLKRSIPYHQLTRKFQEVIYLAYKLKISYLWIDTLCIMQDSLSDWKIESSRMASVYQNAIINFAPVSESEEGVCFKQRNLISSYPCRTGTGKVSIYRNKTFGREFAVLSRGWICQERILSARTVYLGASNLLWECCGSIWNDDRGLGDLEIMYGYYNKLQQGNSAHEIAADADASMSIEEWNGIVRGYSICKLTYASDMLAALAGIASDFGARTSLTYISGMWKEHIVHGSLLWREVYAGMGPYAGKTRPRFRGHPLGLGRLLIRAGSTFQNIEFLQSLLA